MVTFTTNKSLGMPVVGGDTGAWGQPLNNNSSVLDASLGGVATIPISSVAGALTLLASNYDCVFLNFTGAITQNTVITLPAVGSFYTVQNLTTNTSQFTVTLQTTAAGSQSIGCPPYQAQDVLTDGSNVKFRGLPHVGAYWDYAGPAVPNWVTACTVPPWLNCDGTAFSSATYPYLATILGGTTLPDSRGRFRATLNQTTTRIVSSTTGVDGTTVGSGGGITTLSSQNIPPVPITDPGHIHTANVDFASLGQGGIFAEGAANRTLIGTNSATTGITAGSTSPAGFVPPTYIGGITMIRAG